VLVTAPVLIGSGAHVGEGVSLHGPVVVGDGCHLGAGAMLRECVVLPATQVPAGGLIVGGLYGVDADRRLG
jgi:carbonic anhydrase/acetyltransferase-like protein (isoleucine patch superfamily)